MGYDNENDQVDDEARKEKERVETDLRRAVFGSDTNKNNSRLSRSLKTEKAILIADEKKKKEEESRTRETLKRAQEALEEHLRALDEELERLRKALRDLDELEDLIKAGKFDKNDNHHQELLRSTGMSVDDVQAPDALTRTEERRKTFEERRKEVLKEKEYLKEGGAKILQSDVPDHVKLQEMQELLSHGTSVGVEFLWKDRGASEGVRKVAGDLNTAYGLEFQSQQAEMSFPEFSGASVSGNGNFGKGIESKMEDIQKLFASAATFPVPKVMEGETVQNPSLKGPKLPS